MSLTPGESTWDQDGAPRLEGLGSDADHELPDGELVWSAFRVSGLGTDVTDTEAPEAALTLEPVSPEELEELGFTPDQLSGLQRLAELGHKTLETAGRYKIMIILGAMTVGIAADIVFDPGGVAGDLALPAIAYGIGEVGWCITAWAAGAAVGKRLSLDPRKIHEFFEQLTDRSIATAAKGNTKFWSYFWANRGIAALQGLVPIGLIVANSPPEGYSKTLFFIVDLVATWAVGQGIWNAAHPKELEDNSSE